MMVRSVRGSRDLDDILHGSIARGTREDVAVVITASERRGVRIGRVHLGRCVVTVSLGLSDWHLTTHDPGDEILHLRHILLHIEEHLIEDLSLVSEGRSVLTEHGLLTKGRMIVYAQIPWQVARDGLCRHGTLLLEDADAVGEVAQLTDIPWPAIALEELSSLGRQTQGRHMVALSTHRSKETEEQGNILHTATQGRHLDGYGIETEEEVFAEAATLDSLLQVHIRCSDDAHIGLLGLACPDGDEFPRLEDTQETGLRREGKLPYFVEEDRTARGFLEVSLAVGDSARERALQVTEELGVDGPLRDSPTVHSDIRAVLANTILMDDLREALLPDTALTDHQHRHIGGCHLHGRADSIVE